MRFRLIIYLLVFGLLLFSSVMQYYRSQNLAVFLFFTGFLLSIFVNSFRDMIGGYDIYIYAQYFDNVVDNGNFLNYEYGYYLLNFFLYNIYPDRYFFFAIVGLLLLAVFYFFSIKVTNRLAFLIFFLIFCKLYFYTFVYLRQMFAVSLVWFGFYFLFKGDRSKFIIFSILGSLFHLSALIVLPLFFIRKIFNIKLVVLIFILGLILGLFVSVQQVFVYLGAALDNERLISNSYNNNAINYFYFLEAVLIYIWLVLRFDFYKREVLKYQIVFNLALIYVFFNLLTINDATALRMTWFFLIGPILFFVNELNSNIKHKGILFFIILLYFSMVFLRIMFVWDSGDFLPYKSIFEDAPRFGRWEFLEYK